MKTTPTSSTPVSRFHADVASVVGIARKSGPVLLTDETGNACGIVLGLDGSADLENLQDWLLETSPEAKEAFAAGAADKAAGRMTPHDEVVREILGA